MTGVTPDPRIAADPAAEHAPRSRGHHVHVLPEGVKVLVLLAGGVLVLAVC